MTSPGARTRLYLVRHEMVADPMTGRCLPKDAPLQVGAVERAQRLGAAFAGAGVDAIYASPLRRSRDTACAIAVATGLDPVEIDALSEIDFGTLDGLPFTAIAQAHPTVYAEWMRSPWTVQFPGGESLADMKSRVLSAASAIRRGREGQTVVLVTHAGPIRAIVADALALPDLALFRLDIGTGSVSVIDWVGGEPIVRGINRDGPSHEVRNGGQ